MKFFDSLKLSIAGTLLYGLTSLVNPVNAQISGQVIDVITGEGIPNIEVVNEGVDSTFTDMNGYYNLDVVGISPLQLDPLHGQSISFEGSDIFNIKGERLGELENQTLENFLTTKNVANGMYFIRTDPNVNKGIISTGKALRLESEVHWGGPESLKSSYVTSSKSPTRSLDDNFINLFFMDERDTTKGDYFDIERYDFEITGSLEQNEEMVPTWITKQSNPFDTTFVDYDYFMDVLNVIPENPLFHYASTWKHWGYDSVGVYIPETLTGSTYDYQQLVMYSLLGQTSQSEPYDGWSTVVADLNRANNFPVFFIAPDCTYVVDNGGAYVEYLSSAPWNAHVNPIRGPPSPLKEVEFNLGYFNSKPELDFLKISAHEFGHVQGFTDLYDDQYSNKIMYINISTSLYIGDGTIDDQTTAVSTVHHNRTDPNYGVIKNK